MSEAITRSFLRGFDKALALWLLDQEPRCCYGLITELRKVTGKRTRTALMYSFLRNLESNGYLAGRLINDGRRIRTYCLTSKGKRLLSRVRELFQTSLGDMLMDISGLR